MTAEEIVERWQGLIFDKQQMINLITTYGQQKQNEVLDKAAGLGINLNAVVNAEGIIQYDTIRQDEESVIEYVAANWECEGLLPAGYNFCALTLIDKQSILNLKNKL